MTEQKMITIHTRGGAIEAPVLAEWTETVGTSAYTFALHVIPQQGEYNPVLGISEVQTGASMQAPLVHPNGSGQLRESHTKPGHRGYLPKDKLERLAYRALKRQIGMVAPERFEMMVGMNLMARHQRDQALLTKRNEELLAVEKPIEAAAEEKPLDQAEPEVELPTVTAVKDGEQ